MNQSKFTENEIPYHILNRFGLTQEMIEDLPTEDFEKLKNGRRTPILPVRVENDKGETILSRARISLVRNEASEVRVLFYPKLITTDLSRFDANQQKALLNGEAISAPFVTPDGKKCMAYHQVDNQTGQVMAVPTHILANNIKLVADTMHLSEAEINSIKNGKHLTILDNEREKTIGISLKTKSALRIVEGDEDAWKDQERKEYAHYNFGLNGCWVADEDGNLDYVPQDEYGEDMWDEMKKRGNLQRNAVTHKM